MIRIILIWLMLTFPAQASSLRERVEQYSTIERTEQIECIARAIYFEARGEPLEGQLAVAQVIINRVKHRKYPNSACSVINKEFSFNKKAIHKPTKTIYALAYIAINNLWVDVTHGATHFHSVRVNPKWRYTHTTTIGAHKFYRID